ncbi:hypothetical protein [Paractinoplanes atraurantiacus]|uniref:Uncharacterized protein n=1 Tax=Paractinoplanes atraurantiacus TaxID=1036182 RepID=A0A285HQ48_9ACTN|nr:hypothetical protein [Actinoplanes atraurantiacus]SNY37880.1 hypothetical protein SAMN05421748_105154 [Actinoplanes atraurantiacus]
MTGPLRPVFTEGQVLAAADLSATVGYARGAAARHERYLHEWGIADGLTLTTENRTDPASNARFVEVSVQPGLAVDGTGREIVVAAPVVLSEAEFQEVNGADQPTADPYPVFLTAADQPGSTRVEEGYQILFGRLGDERLVAEQQPPAVGAAPAEPPARWLVLLGFVRWTDGHFAAVTARSGTIRPRYAGVRADTVAARSGTLALRTQSTVQEGKPALVLSGDDPPSLVFGLYQGSGTVSPLMTVAANGNLTVAGSFSGQISAGSVLVTSGTATDGMLLPLPSGVSPEEVADGRVSLHVHVTPRTAPAGSATMLAVAAEATVDGERRVRCRIRYYDPIETPAEVVERPGAVDYLVLATNGGA